MPSTTKGCSSVARPRHGGVERRLEVGSLPALRGSFSLPSGSTRGRLPDAICRAHRLVRLFVILMDAMRRRPFVGLGKVGSGVRISLDTGVSMLRASCEAQQLSRAPSRALLARELAFALACHSSAQLSLADRVPGTGRGLFDPRGGIATTSV